MRLPDTERFVRETLETGGYLIGRHTHLKQAGFQTLYVRLSTKQCQGERLMCFTIATVSVSKPGLGTFTQYLGTLNSILSEVDPDSKIVQAVYVENVGDDRLGRFLERNGFVIASRVEESKSYSRRRQGTST